MKQFCYTQNVNKDSTGHSHLWTLVPPGLVMAADFWARSLGLCDRWALGPGAAPSDDSKLNLICGTALFLREAWGPTHSGEGLLALGLQQPVLSISQPGPGSTQKPGPQERGQPSPKRSRPLQGLQGVQGCP